MERTNIMYLMCTDDIRRLTTIFGNVACTRAEMYSTRGSVRDVPSSSPIVEARPPKEDVSTPHRVRGSKDGLRELYLPKTYDVSYSTLMAT